MVGTGGGGSERKVARFGVSVTVAIARASHFALLVVCLSFYFRLLVRSLVLRTLLHWAVVLPTSMSYPARPGIWFCVFGGLDGVSEMLQWLRFGVVVLR